MSVKSKRSVPQKNKQSININKDALVLALQETKLTPSSLDDVANNLILGNQAQMSIWAKRLFVAILRQVKNNGENQKTYIIQMEDFIKYFDAEGDKEIYQYIRDAAGELMQEVLSVENIDYSKAWIVKPFLNEISYDGNGKLYCTLPDSFRSYILKLVS